MIKYISKRLKPKEAFFSDCYGKVPNLKLSGWYFAVKYGDLDGSYIQWIGDIKSRIEWEARKIGEKLNAQMRHMERVEKIRKQKHFNPIRSFN